MAKAFRAELSETMDGFKRPAGYVYALTEEALRSRVKRLHEKNGAAWNTAISKGPVEIEITDKLYDTLSRDTTTSLWSPYGKSKGDATVIA
jgi:hypothetical protein